MKFRVTAKCGGLYRERVIEAPSAGEARRRMEGMSSIGHVIRVVPVEKEEG